MRISSLIKYMAGIAALAFCLHAVPGGGAIGEVKAAEYAKPKRAFEQGIRHYRRGDLDRALKALEYASKKGHFRAKYYLARIYAKNSNPYTNHARAFELYQEIADQYAEVDPVYNLRAPYVARAFVELARYLKAGVPELKFESDKSRAAAYLDHAAKYFGDREAQFELAKMYLSGDGVRANERRGKHWLSSLARKGHAEAQAYLGDLYVRGEYVERNKVHGMAFIMLALENAREHNRIWIDELYQNAFCASTPKIRDRAVNLAAGWRQKFRAPGRRAGTKEIGLGIAEFRARRTCRNGEQVAFPSIPTTNAGSGTDRATIPSLKNNSGSGDNMLGATTGFGLRNVGATGQGGGR